MNKYHKIKVSSTSRDGLAKQIYAYKQQGYKPQYYDTIKKYMEERGIKK